MKSSGFSRSFSLVALVGLGPLIGSFSDLSAASNWHQWRGPNANGIVDAGNLPVEWSESKNIEWKVAVPGKGHATPIIWEDKIFLLTVTAAPGPEALAPTGEVRGQIQRRPQGRPPGRGGEGRRRGGRGGRGRGGAPTTEHTFTTLCLDRGTGKTLWETVSRREVPHQGVQRTNTYGSGSPATDGEHLYVSFGSHGLYCYDLDGKLVWKKDLGKVNVTFGEASSPTLYGETLIVLQDNNGESFIYAFDKRTGKQLWKKSRDEGSGWTTPYVMERDGKTQVLVSGSNAVRSYDIKSGEVIWQCSGLGSNPVPMIVADDENIYAMSGHRQPFAMAVKMGGTGDLSDTDAVLWTTTRGTPYVPSPLLYDGLLFYCQRTDAILSCVDAKSGEVHFSQERLSGISGVYASPVGIADRVYLPGQNGATVVFRKSKELDVLAVNRLDDEFDASPAIVGDQLFLRGHSNLYCIAE